MSPGKKNGPNTILTPLFMSSFDHAFEFYDSKVILKKLWHGTERTFLMYKSPLEMKEALIIWNWTTMVTTWERFKQITNKNCEEANYRFCQRICRPWLIQIFSSTCNQRDLIYFSTNQGAERKRKPLVCFSVLCPASLDFNWVVTASLFVFLVISVKIFHRFFSSQ